MRYLCLIYLDDADRDALAGRECGIAFDAFHAVHPAVTVLVRGGEIRVVDGPAAESSKPLVGICVIDARDLNDAIRIVAKTPAASAGCIEVRLIQEFDLGEKTREPRCSD